MVAKKPAAGVAISPEERREAAQKRAADAKAAEEKAAAKAAKAAAKEEIVKPSAFANESEPDARGE